MQYWPVLLAGTALMPHIPTYGHEALRHHALIKGLSKWALCSVDSYNIPISGVVVV